MKVTFSKGDRVCLSKEAVRTNLHRWTRHRERMGTVVSNTLQGVGVTWDGNSPKSVTTYHPDYLAPTDTGSVT